MALYKKKCPSENVSDISPKQEKVSVTWLYIRKSVRHLALYKKKWPSFVSIRKRLRHLQYENVSVISLYKKKCPSFGSI